MESRNFSNIQFLGLPLEFANAWLLRGFPDCWATCQRGPVSGGDGTKVSHHGGAVELPGHLCNGWHEGGPETILSFRSVYTPYLLLVLEPFI